MAEKRQWQEREMRLVAEYLTQFHPRAIKITRVRLGAIPQLEMPLGLEEEGARIAGNVRAWADALALYPDRTILVEAAIRPTWGEDSKLLNYANLFRLTPEYRDRWTLPLSLELVYAIGHPLVIRDCLARGIKVVQFSPPWLDEYLAILFPRERSVPRLEG